MAAYPDPLDRRRTVLVAVMNNPDDLRRAASEGWYRIPQRRAPHRIGADYLAFYQTGAFEGRPEAHTVTYYAPIRRYQLLIRAELIPTEVDHPRANDYYFRIDIGPFQRLDHPISAARLRRVTFIHTTLDRLLTATDVRDLYRKEDPFETLWQALRENRLRPLRNRLAGDWPVDIALRARGGYLGIQCQEDDSVQERRPNRPPAPWTLLSLTTDRIQEDMAGCLRLIGATLIDLGGSR
jgi:hypothetical protein